LTQHLAANLPVFAKYLELHARVNIAFQQLNSPLGQPNDCLK